MSPALVASKMPGKDEVMVAKVKDNPVEVGFGETKRMRDIKRIVACAGQEYIRGEWRQVPAGMEGEAEHNIYLDVKIVKAGADLSKPEPAAKSAANAKAPKGEAPNPKKK